MFRPCTGRWTAQARRPYQFRMLPRLRREALKKISAPPHCSATLEIVKVIQLIAHGTPGQFELREIPNPTPGPAEVVVAVRACGLNHLDLWLESAGLPVAVPLPRTPGGEVAGVIHSVGSQVSDWQPGDRVAIQSNLFCGQCEFCLSGDESLCLRGELLGVTRDG
jgi:D-arabinose 1-dehydrogenase-like Zn-dependent alcohol dehydrogenase